MPISPLTGSSDCSLLETMPRETIERVYAQSGIDISGMLPRSIEVWLCNESGLKFTDPCITGSSEFYASIAKDGTYYAGDKFEFGWAARQVPVGSKVLDIGCGAGAFAANLKHADFTGLEFSPLARGIAVTNGLDVLDESAEEHSAKNSGKYQTVTCFQVLEHVSDPAGLLKAISECLTPGGRAIISVPAEDSLLGLSTDGLFNLPPHHVTFWTDAALREALTRSGLKNIEIHHEPLQPEHAEFFAQQLVLVAINGGRSWGRVGKGWRFRIANKVAWLLRRKVAKALLAAPWVMAGHTVVATGVKAADIPSA